VASTLASTTLGLKSFKAVADDAYSGARDCSNMVEFQMLTQAAHAHKGREELMHEVMHEVMHIVVHPHRRHLNIVISTPVRKPKHMPKGGEKKTLIK
jgi:hypothetical protein